MTARLHSKLHRPGHLSSLNLLTIAHSTLEPEGNMMPVSSYVQPEKKNSWSFKIIGDQAKK